MIHRREVIANGPVTDWQAVWREVRALTGYGTPQLVYVFNVPRSTLRRWEQGADPGYDRGRDILEAVSRWRICATQADRTAA